MLTVPQSIAPLVASQLPAFYEQEGPLFILFVEAYYEWLGQNVDRQILANRDIDLAADVFLESFKSTYLPNITFDAVTNKRLLVKNAIDIYRSKGTSRGIDLFMRLVYGVPAEIFFPGDKVLRASDAKWTLPRFIEVTKSPYTRDLVHKLITGGTSGATAFVESVVERRTETDRVDVVNISDIRGTFIIGEPISAGQIYNNSPQIVGSVIRAVIDDGGENFAKYDELTFKGLRGGLGSAKVIGVDEDGGITDVKITDSGIGFSDGETAYLQYGAGITGASMVVEVGAVGHQEGYYTSGALLGDAHLHDSDYWQEFSYDVLTALPLTKYVTALKDVLHLAGHKMFGSVVVESYTDYLQSISTGGTPEIGENIALSLDFANGVYVVNSISTPSPTLDSRITFSRTSNATMYDSTGKLTYAPNNITRYSDTLTAAGSGSAWGGLVGGTAPSDNQITFASQYSVWTQRHTLSVGKHIIAFRAQRQSGNTALYFYHQVGTAVISEGVFTAFTITDTLAQYFLIINVTTAGSIDIGIQDRNAAGQGTILVDHFQVEQVTYETTPRTYNATTGSAYYGPRLEYNPATLAARGLLIEEARTNLLTYSEQFDNAAWSKSDTIAANTTVAPDGTTTADTATYASSSVLYQAFTSVASTVYTASWWVKRGTCTGLNYKIFDASNAASIVANTSYFSSTSSDWVRFVVTFTTPVGCVSTRVYLTETGTAGETVHFWGAQVELGAFATSYIPTTSATVTRAADSASMTGTNFSSWYNQSAGTFVVEFDGLNTANARAIGLGLSATPAFINNSYTSFGFYDNNSAIAAAGNDARTGVKVASSYDTANRSISASGGAATTGSLVSSSPATLWLGSDQGSSSILNGHIKSLTYYATRKSDAELVTLST